jgi:signal transduction histidine kinase
VRTGKDDGRTGAQPAPVRPWLTRSVRKIRDGGQSAPRRNPAFPLAVLLAAVLHLVAGAAGILEPAPGLLLTVLQAALVAGQALALLYRWTAPGPAFVAVVLLHSVLLASSAAELGIGSLAVMLAAYHLIRRAARPPAFRVLAAMAAVSSGVAMIAALLAGRLPLPAVLGLIVARIVFEYLVPALIAEFNRGRSQLRDAAREREQFTERERAYLIEQDRRAERTALARELHDIAGHHLSGIIVSAQAAGALIASDPERSRRMLRELEDEARATMADLRGTVGLLRPDENPKDGGGGRATIGIPGLGDLPSLLDAAARRGQRVSFSVTGDPHRVGPVAEASIYRTVQESLTNAARHAPDADCVVSVEYRPDELVVVVENAPASGPPAHATEGRPGGRGYGLIGMNERADLIGADLDTGPTAGGGWRNRLRIPHPARGRS